MSSIDGFVRTAAMVVRMDRSISRPDVVRGD